MAYSQLQLRPHVKPTEQVHGLIAPGSCWHFDAWLYRSTAGELYAVIEQRKGGRDLLARHVYWITGDRLRYVPALPDAPGCVEVTLQDRALRAEFDRLNRIHWQYIAPMAARVPSGFRSRSVALHYVRAPSIAPFGDDVVNMSLYAD